MSQFEEKCDFVYYISPNKSCCFFQVVCFDRNKTDATRDHILGLCVCLLCIQLLNLVNDGWKECIINNNYN